MISRCRLASAFNSPLASSAAESMSAAFIFIFTFILAYIPIHEYVVNAWTGMNAIRFAKCPGSGHEKGSIRRSAVNIDRAMLMLSRSLLPVSLALTSFVSPLLGATLRLCRSQPLASGLHRVLPGGHYLLQAGHERGTRVRDYSRQGLKVDRAFVRAIGLSKINAGDHLGWSFDSAIKQSRFAGL